MFNKNYDHQFTFHFDVLILYKFIPREKIIRNSSIYPSSFIQKFLSHREKKNFYEEIQLERSCNAIV